MGGVFGVILSILSAVSPILESGGAEFSAHERVRLAEMVSPLLDAYCDALSNNPRSAGLARVNIVASGAGIRPEVVIFLSPLWKAKPGWQCEMSAALINDRMIRP